MYKRQLKDYAGTEKQVSIYAKDYAGNRSDVVKLDNPYYKEPVSYTHLDVYKRQEQDAKRLLMERLDECLKVHAYMLDAQNIGSIYELQGLSERHYYLKVEHVFTPAEVEALLSFQGVRHYSHHFPTVTFCGS